jgi:hypothetical protein
MSEINVTRVKGEEFNIPEGTLVYEVQDDETRDGVYYIVLSKDGISVYSVDENTGDPIIQDMNYLLIKSGGEIESEDREDGTMHWEKEIPQVLSRLVGPVSAALIMDEAGIEYSDLPPEGEVPEEETEEEVAEYLTMSFTFHPDMPEEETPEKDPSEGDHDSPPPGPIPSDLPEPEDTPPEGIEK